jgi:large subunit ribosomal protein L4
LGLPPLGTMATIDIHDLGGNKVGTAELADEVFGAINEDLLWEAVKHYRAAQRAGTHATKNRWRVSGSGKKLWRQKGTGRARVGSIRSPLWRHGGTVHGPQPRSYEYHFPRKKLLGALRSALASKFSDGKLIVVNAFDVKEPKTQPFREALDALQVKGSALLLEVANHGNRNLVLASRNLEGVELLSTAEVHPYHLLRYDRVIFSQAAIEKLQTWLKNSASRREPRSATEEEVKPKKKVARSRTKKATEVAQ